MTGDTTAPKSRSQYSGTLKDTLCTRCGKNLNNMNRLQQDDHEAECVQQKRLL